MTSLFTSVTAVASVLVLGGCSAWGEVADAADAPAAADSSLAQAIGDLPVAEEDRSGYTRDRFSGWNDADKDGCDTRDEVLLEEDRSGGLSEADCDGPMVGEWVSAYDGVTITQSSKLDIDHYVPLAEAWDSGASGWDADQRARYATYLDDERHLVAVTAASNRSKSDQDPAEWMPPAGGVACEYVATWTAIKTAWKLSVDEAERAALLDEAAACPDTTVTVRSVS